MQLLRDLQLGFLHSIFSRDDTGFSKHTVSMGNQGMAIYRNNVFGGLTKTLEITYPVTLQLVGEDFFKRAATEFVYQNPSTSGDLHRFGGNFAEFLSCFPAAAELTYLPDIARLEWLCHEVFYEADHGIFDINTLPGIFLQGFIAGLFGIIAGVFLLKLLGNREIVDIYHAFHTKFWKAKPVQPSPEEIIS